MTSTQASAATAHLWVRATEQASPLFLGAIASKNMLTCAVAACLRAHTMEQPSPLTLYDIAFTKSTQTCAAAANLWARAIEQPSPLFLGDIALQTARRPAQPRLTFGRTP